MAAGYHYGVKLRITPTGLSPASAAASLAALPRPALPGVVSRTGLSATPTGPACPSRGSGWFVPRHRRGFPCCAHPPSCMRAAAITPAEPVGALVARFPADGSLPRFTGGSASALPVSRPAQRSPKLRPAYSLNRPWRPFSSECFRRCRYLLRPLRLQPAGATVAGRDSHPLRDGAFARRTVKMG